MNKYEILEKTQKKTVSSSGLLLDVSVFLIIVFHNDKHYKNKVSLGPWQKVKSLLKKFNKIACC